MKPLPAGEMSNVRRLGYASVFHYNLSAVNSKNLEHGESTVYVGFPSYIAHITRPDRWADSALRSTLGFCNLQYRSIRVQNLGLYFVDPPGVRAQSSLKGPQLSISPRLGRRSTLGLACGGSRCSGRSALGSQHLLATST